MNRAEPTMVRVRGATFRDLSEDGGLDEHISCSDWPSRCFCLVPAVLLVSRSLRVGVM